MEQIYTIPVNEVFEASAADPACGCPLCMLYNRLEENELSLILGASMMEPDVRIQTNQEGFCRIHYDQMITRQNRLSMALTLESHLAELSKGIRAGGFLSSPGQKPIKRIGSLEESCYICRRIASHYERMLETTVLLWQKEEEFRAKFAAQPYFCLPHYRRLLLCAADRLTKKEYKAFCDEAAGIVERYLEKVSGDVSWFCKKFDYRYDKEPWYDAKDAVERAVRFLRSDLHQTPEKKK